MELPDLIAAAGRLSATDDLFAPEAEEIYDQLLVLHEDHPEAALAAGRLAWQRHLAALQPFDLGNLLVAVTLLHGFPGAEPPELALVRQVEVPDDVEPAAPEALYHPAKLVMGGMRMYRELDCDRSAEDIARLIVQTSLVMLGMQWTRPDGELRPLAIDALALMVQALLGATSRAELIPYLVQLRRDAVAAARPGDDETGEFLRELGLALAVQFAAGENIALLDEAESLLELSRQREQVEPAPEPSLEDRTMALAEYLDLLVRVATADGSLHYQHLALALARNTLVNRTGQELTQLILMGDGGPGGTANVAEHDVGGEPIRTASVNWAEMTIAAISEEMEKTPWWKPWARARLYAELSEIYRDRFHNLRRTDFLDRAVDLARAAVRHSPRWHRSRTRSQSVLAAALVARYQLREVASDRDEAITALRSTSRGSREVVGNAMVMLASLLAGRYEDTHDLRDLAEAEAIARRAERDAAEGSEAAFEAAGVLGQVLLTAHEAGSSGLDDAITWLRKASALPDGHINRHIALMNLAAGLAIRYRGGGPAADLDEAIDHSRAAIEGAQGHADQWPRVHELRGNLATMLTFRYRAQDTVSDLDAAIELSRKVVDALPQGHPLIVESRAALAERLASHAARTGAETTMAEALWLAEQAVAESTEDTRASTETSLARVLATPVGQDRVARLERAIALRRSPSLRAHDSENGVALAGLLTELFLLRGDVELAREAESLHPEGSLELASLRYERGKLDGDREALSSARDLARVIASNETEQVPGRIAAARIRGAAAAALGDWQEAADGFALAVGLLSALAPRTLARADQEYRLAATADLASDAAVAAVRAGDPVLAVQLFERARGVLWSQLGGNSLDALESAAPELAERYRVLRAELGRETGAARPDPRFPYAWRRLLTGEPGELAERQRALGSRWLDTLAEIRALDGFEEFPAEPLTDRPHPGVAGEVVLLAVSDHGGYALIVRPESVDVLPLPLLTSHSARRQADVLRTALDALEDPELPLAEQARREGDIGACLAWLRTTVTTPVLERCGERVWWIPAGPLAALPIHAAALDEVCSSYSPTLAALRGSASSGEADALLLVAMPETPGAPPLPGVVAEIDLLRSLSPVELIGQDATKAVVTAALAECEIAHFACHSAPATDHAPARLLLHDHQTEPLTLLDIAHISVPSGRLAYLSSCATSLGSAQLADEATHLAAAFGLAGFPQVVATLWPVDDQTALDVTTSCYSLMRTERGVDPTGAAEALHSSTLELAARNPGNPSLWACHIHVGR